MGRKTRRSLGSWLRPTAVVVALTTAVVATTLHGLWVAYEGFTHVGEVQFDLEAAAGEVRYLDEVLTMSTTVAAATGDPQWRARYERHAAELDRVLGALLERERMEAVGRSISIANDVLLDHEERAFAFVESGELESARALLRSESYRRHKAAYAEGIQSLLDSVTASIRGSVAERVSRLLILAGVLLSLIVALNLAWWRLLGHMRRRRDQLAVAEREANEARRSAEVADASKSRFLGEMSHEMRTPLHAITGFAELLERDQSLGVQLDRAAKAEALRSIRSAAVELDEWFVRAMEVAGVDADEAPSVQGAPAGASQPIRRVLVVDDLPMNRRLMTRILSQLDLAADSAENGRLALEAVEEAAARGRPFDLVLMDLDMPVMDGRTASGELRRRGFRGRVIAFTADVTARVLDEDETPFDGLLPKPVARHELESALGIGHAA